ncbi:DUF3307 domain-containing protein [Fonticella tunisiensis]|uniref:DUF3307 domain-containing protein n=1 Tax=Fonticella tunisiensis TaxID=1096341 RepID=UPI00242AF2D3|nr:DUF3307 domain-containing protein [Fonticella tunisiensis]
MIFAHMVSDFLLQSNYIVKLRYSPESGKSLRGNLLHALVYFMVSLAFIINYMSVQIFFTALAIGAFHFLVDYIKSVLAIKSPFTKYSLSIFVVDQVVHMAFIIFMLLPKGFKAYIAAFSHQDVRDKFAVFKNMEYMDRLLVSGILIIAALWGTGIFIRIFFDHIKLKPYKRAINMNIKIREDLKETDGAPDGGFIIGILERLFIICSILLDLPQVIGFVLATKSIARFKRFDDDEFVELFIIGSFISFISAIIVGVIVKGLSTIPY